jgi:hypothetical protein
MRVSTVGDDLIIIHCERFENGKTNIKNPDTLLMIGLLPLFFAFICISQFSLVQFEFYLSKHLPLIISITFFLITTIICSIDDLFLSPIV